MHVSDMRRSLQFALELHQLSLEREYLAFMPAGDIRPTMLPCVFCCDFKLANDERFVCDCLFMDAGDDVGRARDGKLDHAHLT